MKTLIELLNDEMVKAFEKAGYDSANAKVVVSNRPDLCEYQCNGAMALAKANHCAPIEIANKVAEALGDAKAFSSIEAVMPGFLNLKIADDFLKNYLNESAKAYHYGVDKVSNPRKIVIDYGGPNVAKPLHVGHLRSAIIGESVKRIGSFMGNEMIGDIHMGDWGLQMGLIIAELKNRKPELPYFDEAFTGEYPDEAPFSLSELEEIYPAASAKSKEDESFKAAAMDATYRLQHEDKAYLAIWKHIMNLSVTDLKKNYENLDVHFELWKGEADADPYIKPMVDKMKAGGFTYESDGAIVVDVSDPSDKKEMPPCMILKSDGAALYTTTDLATLVQRMEDYSPDEVIYVVDKRQELHFDQVFRCAKKVGIVPDSTKLKFIGFGTMNGKDGKPFKTREGGVMRLERLIGDIKEQMLNKMKDNGSDISSQEAMEIASIVGLAAIKYGDLSNQAAKDYVFDMDRFTSFEGDTGPYILYTIVRCKSILRKYKEGVGKLSSINILPARSASEKDLQLALTGFHTMMDTAYAEWAPHKICAYIYELSNAFNRFYHENKILTEPDEEVKKGYISLVMLTCNILTTCIELLGFSSPNRM